MIRRGPLNILLHLNGGKVKIILLAELRLTKPEVMEVLINYGCIAMISSHMVGTCVRSGTMKPIPIPRFVSVIASAFGMPHIHDKIYRLDTHFSN